MIAYRKRQQRVCERRARLDEAWSNRIEFRMKTLGAYTAFIAATVVALVSTDAQFPIKGFALGCLLGSLPALVGYIMLDRIFMMHRVRTSVAREALMVPAMSFSLLGLILVAFGYSPGAMALFVLGGGVASVITLVALWRLRSRLKRR